MTQITEWFLEEKDQLTGKVRTRQFTDYNEALDAFTAAEENPDNLVSLSKKTRKLLLED